ncbi:MAG: hypothetical protein OEZ59_04285 [Deltaproteobacteria bacterium]|nr:hypothetical protein [Deltaproteobacteria bacterium]
MKETPHPGYLQDKAGLEKQCPCDSGHGKKSPNFPLALLINTTFIQCRPSSLFNRIASFIAGFIALFREAVFQFSGGFQIKYKPYYYDKRVIAIKSSKKKYNATEPQNSAPERRRCNIFPAVRKGRSGIRVRELHLWAYGPGAKPASAF